MRSMRWLLAMLAVLGLVAAGCGDDDDAVVGGADASDDDSSDDDTDESTDDDEATTDDATDESTTDEAVTDDDEPTTTVAAETTTTGVDVSEDTVSVFDLAVGDCINTDQLTGAVSEVGALDCAAPHDFEIYFAFDLPDGDFPGDDVISAEAETQCLGDSFSTYVGIDYQSSTFYAQPLSPTVESWAGGDREVLCMLYATNDGGVTVAPYTGSAQGSGL